MDVEKHMTRRINGKKTDEVEDAVAAIEALNTSGVNSALMRREFINGTYIQADETPMDVHMPYFWQYCRPGGTVVFDFRLGRGRDGSKQVSGTD